MNGLLGKRYIACIINCLSSFENKWLAHREAQLVKGGRRAITPFEGGGSMIEEGNGNPLQYSCLENPMDGRAW